MSKITEAGDRDTLAVIGRSPGVKRKDPWVNAAASSRLIRAGLIVAPTTNGRLYLTEAGTELHWSPAPREQAPSGGTVVATTVNCEVVLDSYGFYARCTNCPWVSEYTPAKHVARRWASEHDQG